MALLETTSYVLHLAFAGLWTGTVLFVALGVLPVALLGDVGVEPLEFVLGRLALVSRASALVLFVTGGYTAGQRYTVETLTGQPRGHLVLAMVGLWFLLALLVEVAVARARSGLAERKVRTPAADARPFLYGAVVVAVLLLLDAGVLAAGSV